MPASDVVSILQLAISPVILISGVGLLLLSMTNRLGRAIDRSRLLAESYRKCEPDDEPRILVQLEILSRRTRLLRSAITFGGSSVLGSAIMVIVLFVVNLLKIEAATPVVCVFAFSMVCLVVSLIFFLKDINLSLRAVDLEIEGSLKHKHNRAG